LLGFQVPDIGNGQIVGKIQGVVPIQVPVQGSGAKTGRLELFAVLIDPLDALQECFPFAVKVAVMI